MPDLQREYCLTALDSVLPWLYLLPSAVQRNIKLAHSVLLSHGSATQQEMQEQLGTNWVLARRTKRIVERYGPDVRCYSQAQYAAAERRAIEGRVPVVEAAERVY
jgi:hypothetical protein